MNLQPLITVASFNYNLNITAVIGGGIALLLLIFFLKHLHWGIALAVGVVAGGLIGVLVARSGDGDLLELVQVSFGIIGAGTAGFLSLAASLVSRRSKGNNDEHL